MPNEITKDAYNVLCTLYREYLNRRKEGASKVDAVQFSPAPEINENLFPGIPLDDLNDAILELGRSGYLKIYIGGAFLLEKSAIILMESRFKNGIKEVTDFISKFIP